MLFKAVALGASFVNVVVAGFMLPPEIALPYLALLSTIQTMIPFAGLGLGQRLVGMSAKDAAGVRVWPWFAASAGLGVLFLTAQMYAAGLGYFVPLFGVAVILLLHITISEYIRAGQSRHTGFHIFNLALLALASQLFIEREFNSTSLVIGAAALAALMIGERGFLMRSAIGRPFLSPRGKDLSTALRVMCINQYYNVLVVALALVVASPELLSIVLVWRFNIFFNWQAFYWLRFGHKDLGHGPTPQKKLENRKVIALNIAACAATLGIGLVVLNTGLLGYLEGTAFDITFLHLLILYALVRTAINLIFPHELFAIYGASGRQDLIFFTLAAMTFAAIIGLAVTAPSPVILLIGVELGVLIWRLSCAMFNRSPGAGA